jgi:hypothetical protein
MSHTRSASLSFPPPNVLQIEHSQANPLKLSLAWDPEFPMPASMTLRLEIHESRTVSDSAVPLAAISLSVTDADDQPWEPTFTSQQTNLDLGGNDRKKFFLTISGIVSPTEFYSLAAADLVLLRHPCSQIVPPAVSPLLYATTEDLDDIDARLTVVEETGGGGGGGGGNEITLFCLAGQSNALGTGGDATQAPVPPAGAFQWTTGGGVQALQRTALGGSEWFGEKFGNTCVPQWAVTYCAVTGKKVCFVAGALMGGAGMVAGTSDPGADNFSPTGALRAQIVTRYLAAEAALQAAGYTVIRGGIGFLQGEADSKAIRDAVITEAQYKSGLQGFISYLRTNLGQSFPFYHVRTGTRVSDVSGGTMSGLVAVRRAQEAVAYEDASTFVVCRETAIFNTMGYIPDGVHYNQTAQNLIGREVALITAGLDGGTQFRDQLVLAGTYPATRADDTAPLTIGSPSAAVSSASGIMRSVISTTGLVGQVSETTGTQGTGGGCFNNVYQWVDGAMANNNRLGGYIMGGASSATQMRNAASFESYATETWVNGSANGAGSGVMTTNNGTTTRTMKVWIGHNGRTGIGNGVFGPAAPASAMAHVKGEGTTTALGLLVENSAGVAGFTVRDDGAWAFRGGTVGVASPAWTPFANWTALKTCDVNTVTLQELARIVGTMIEADKAKGLKAA